MRFAPISDRKPLSPALPQRRREKALAKFVMRRFVRLCVERDRRNDVGG